jgi:rsbT co-antagonist protein RsbR
MPTSSNTALSAIITANQDQILRSWLDLQEADSAVRTGRIDRATAADQSRRFLDQLRTSAETASVDDVGAPGWAATREVLEDVARVRAAQGSSPSETAMFVFSLKEPLFKILRQKLGKDADKLADETWSTTVLLDRLGLYTTELAQRTRDAVITRQQEDMMELSTPVVQLWDGVLALPLIGTLDSARTQVVMENLLERIVSSEAEIAIIDITGVPTVDTQVAQHLLKTISAARLMGADCIISGIRPQIAQTIVHLGLQLDVVSKATMADAFALALRRLGKTVVSNGAGSRE